MQSVLAIVEEKINLTIYNVELYPLSINLQQVVDQSSFTTYLVLTDCWDKISGRNQTISHFHPYVSNYRSLEFYISSQMTLLDL